MSSNLVVMNLDRPTFTVVNSVSTCLLKFDFQLKTIHLFVWALVLVHAVKLISQVTINMFRLSERHERNNTIRALVINCVLGQPIFETLRSPKQVFKEEQHPITNIFDWLIESGKSQSPYYCPMSMS
jgi:hypothetical protein